MNYTEKTKRVEEIIAEINSGTTDPGAIIAKIEEAKKLIAECQTELTALEKNLDENSK
ncbi:MAG: exodeoxyribonuclease VII small subunit [Paludibacteraceae bacterium]|nr:exodeoxyribonuclease VII small subunit [Paludibacteraceae bacterium]